METLRLTVYNDFLLGYTKNPHPKIGDRIGKLLIIGAWVNGKGSVKAYRVRCECGTVNEKMFLNNLKSGNSTQCQYCGRKTSEEWRFFFTNYPFKDAKALWGLWHRMSTDERTFPGSETFYTPWRTDLKSFSDHIVLIPKYAQYRDQKVKRGHPDHLSKDRHPLILSGYIPNNIRFSTAIEQARNTKRNLFIEFQSALILLVVFIEQILGPQYSKTKAAGFIRTRYREGKSADEIIQLLAVTDKDIWTPETKAHFFNWYNTKSL